MIEFIKGAIREFKHVVWPTRKETQKFFSLVIAMLVCFGLYLFLASNVFSEIIFGLKSVMGSETSTPSSSSLSEDEIDALFSSEVQIETSTGASATGTVVGTGTTLDIVEPSTSTGEIAQ